MGAFLSYFAEYSFKVTYEVINYMITRTYRPVSYPGDPVKKPLTRLGNWEKKRSSLKGKWKFAADKESHDVTNRMLADSPPLTGESAGRQIWYQEEEETGGRTTRQKKAKAEAENPEFSAAYNPNSGDRLLREIMINNWKGPKPDTKSRPATAREAAAKALSFYQMLQCDDGHWAGDYGGPMFLMPGLIATLYITKAPFPEWKKQGMVEYLRNHQQTDGGWGTHIECASTMFGTVLSYVALRLLGEEADEDHMVKARNFIHEWGGALYAPSWAKVSLSV
jgi:lanosterol synthase